jgi:predicted nucleic acid-binding protein
VTTSRRDSPVVVDTGIFGAGLTARTTPLARRYAPILVGRQLVIAVQTVSELYFGALKNAWGEERLRQLEQPIARAVVAPCDDGLARAAAALRLACLQHGHALAQKVHTNDLWVAAVATHYDIPLVSNDGIFAGVPGLTLLTVTGEA